MSSNEIIRLSYQTVDVFTKTRYAGNPLAIVAAPVTPALTQAQKQIIAREFNYSETIFIKKLSAPDSTAPKDPDDAGAWQIDIFLTFSELPFAGHPVVGAACHVLSAAAADLGQEYVKGILHCKAGPIRVDYSTTSQTARAVVPHKLHVHKTSISPMTLARSQPTLSGVNADKALLDQAAVVSIVDDFVSGLIPVRDEETLAGLSADQPMLDLPQDEGWAVPFGPVYYFLRLPDAEDGTRRLRVRMIQGPLEDPGTGSAASTLAAFIAMNEGKPGDLLKFDLLQGVEMGRESHISLEVKISSDGRIETILLIGSATQVMDGELVI